MPALNLDLFFFLDRLPFGHLHKPLRFSAQLAQASQRSSQLGFFSLFGFPVASLHRPSHYIRFIPFWAHCVGSIVCQRGW